MHAFIIEDDYLIGQSLRDMLEVTNRSHTSETIARRLLLGSQRSNQGLVSMCLVSALGRLC